MIVKCAYCGFLPLADIESLHEKAWDKHVDEWHPEWGYGPVPKAKCDCWSKDEECFCLHPVTQSELDWAKRQDEHFDGGQGGSDG